MLRIQEINFKKIIGYFILALAALTLVGVLLFHAVTQPLVFFGAIAIGSTTIGLIVFGLWLIN